MSTKRISNKINTKLRYAGEEEENNNMKLHFEFENEAEKDLVVEVFEDVKEQKVEESIASYITTPRMCINMIDNYREHTQRLLESERKSETTYYRTRDLMIDTGHHRVVQNQKEINLSLSSWVILDELIKHNGNTVTRDCLKLRLEQIHYHTVTDNLLNVEIRRLRKKLNEAEDNPYIEVIYGLGYRWKDMIIAE